MRSHWASGLGMAALVWASGCGSPGPETEIVVDGEIYDLLVPGEPAGVHPELAGDLAESSVQSLRRVDRGPAEPALDTLPREQLADALRVARTHTNGSVYVAREPNYRAADAVLHGDKVERALRPTLRPRDGASAIGQSAEGLVIGSDGRTLVSATTHPFSAIPRLIVTFPSGAQFQCTGSYIGPWTVLTAAHCLVDPVQGSATRIRFQPGRAGSSVPNNFDCRNDDASTSNNITWGVPAGFMTGFAGNLDYAVIDTWPCYQPPTFFAGYALWANDATYSMHGYPGDTCPGASAPGTFQCGMSGPAYDTDGWILETEHIDSTGGQSGAPWYRALSGTNYVMGVHRGYREYFDFGRCGFDNCRRNYAHLIDDGMHAFIQSISFDY